MFYFIFYSYLYKLNVFEMLKACGVRPQRVSATIFGTSHAITLWFVQTLSPDVNSVLYLFVSSRYLLRFRQNGALRRHSQLGSH